MATRRNPRVDEAVKEAVAAIIERELTDPRLTLVTVTDVRTSADHEHATVYYRAVDPDLIARDPRRTGGDAPAEPDEVQTALEHAAPRIRSLVGGRVRLRRTPELTFVADPVAAAADRVEQLLRGLRGGDDAG